MQQQALKFYNKAYTNKEESMKKFTLSIAAVIAMGTFAIAGGDIAPVEPIVETPVVIEDNSAFYLGLGYGSLTQTSDNISTLYGVDAEWDVDTLLFQAGYQYNKYIAVEGRYWLGIGDATQSETGQPDVDISGDFTAWGIYIKPMYPFGDFSVYGLLGYASVELEADSGTYWNTDEFSWGLGAQYAFADNFLVFVDYVDMGRADDFDFNGETATADISIDTINFGVTYKF